MILSAVLDTNIFVSGIHWTGSSEKIVCAWMENKFKHVSSLHIIEEIVKVLMTFKIPLDPADISWWESLILERSSIVFPSKKVDMVTDDPDDNKFIEAALEGNAHYIVTKDKHLLKIKEYREIKIVTPEEFVKIIEDFRQRDRRFGK